MNENFNRQFFLLDYRLLDRKKFLKFLGSSECATYFVLRRHIWRSDEPHFMGLNELYLNEKRLVCSLTREKISEYMEVRENQISLHLKTLEDSGFIKRIRTGRQSIFVLGEWIDVNKDGSYRGVEWYYLEGKFGIGKSDVQKPPKSENRKSRDQTSAKNGSQTSASNPNQTSAESGDNNREDNREENTSVNVNENKKTSKEKNPLDNVPKINQPTEKVRYMVNEIGDWLKNMGRSDSKSEKFYYKTAWRLPEPLIRQFMAEIKADGADDPAKLFAYKVMEWARQENGKEKQNTNMQKLEQMKQNIARPI